MPQSTHVVMDRQGFHLKVSIYQGWNDNRLAGTGRAAQILKSGTICTGAAADSVRRCWIRIEVKTRTASETANVQSDTQANRLPRLGS